MKERVLYLDIIRIVACCMIVLMHSPHPNAGNPGIILVPLSFITASGIGLFFMVSGALLLPSDLPPLQFVKKRLKKAVPPLFFWTIFYLIISGIKGELSFIGILRAIPSIPFSVQGHGVLWFMYVLIGLYILSPILSGFLSHSSKRDVQFYLLLWVITLCVPFLKEVLSINESPTGILYYFTGYVGYYVLGYYLKSYEPKIGILLSVALIVIPVLFLAAYILSGHEGWQSSGKFWYLSIFVAVSSLGWFNLLKQLSGSLSIFKSNRVRGGVISLSSLSFGVYLVHIFIMRDIIWRWDFLVYNIGGIWQIVITWIFTLVFCFIVVDLLSRIPYSEYLIGYRHRK